MWILTTSASSALLDSFRATIGQNNWTQGVYLLAESLKTAIVVINQLPPTSQTLWLRILGKGAIQQQAIEELIALPQEHPLRSNILELISSWRVTLETKENITEDERELIMNLSPAYLQWREDTLQRGRQQGRRDVVENLLRVRFGSLDEALSGVIDPMLELPSDESTLLLLQLSREELVARFGMS